MPTINVEILRDVSKLPSTVTIKKGSRKLEVEFDPGKGFTIKGRDYLLPTFSDILRMVYPVQSVLSIRGANWFDRNPKSKMDSYAASGVAPHSSTDRLTYTCPPDKIALIEVLGARASRATAATTVGYVSAWFTIISGGTSAAIMAAIQFYDNNVGFEQHETLSANIPLFEDEQLVGTTQDTSTGGTIDHRISYKITEFDR